VVIQFITPSSSGGFGSLPQHGFARNKVWTLESKQFQSSEVFNSVTAVFSLPDRIQVSFLLSLSDQMIVPQLDWNVSN
jgi:D-hexose-6-phosphate mutarotase